MLGREHAVHGRCPLVQVPRFVVIHPDKAPHNVVLITPRLHLTDRSLHVALVVGASGMYWQIVQVPVRRVVIGPTIVTLNQHTVASAGTTLVHLRHQILPEILIRIWSHSGLVSNLSHHDVELYRRCHIVAMLVIVVHGIYFRNGLLQCLEVAIENGVATDAILID